jgi:3-hydroxy-9,10-secoandrosta-1,3,5(10)-triene-9,17-dione monooxygenase
MTPAARSHVPTRDELVARAVALHPALRRHSTDADVNRRLSGSVVSAVADAGLFRLLTPTRFGGFEADVRTVVEVLAALGEADGAAAWQAAIMAGSQWVAGHFPERAQQEIFGPGPDVRFAGSLRPMTARRVDGGLRISGRWPYASGSAHAQWAILGVIVTDGSVGPEGQPGPMMCMAPIGDLTIEDTWHTVGMRGTSSNTLVADEVFIPEHRTVSAEELLRGPATATDTSRYAMDFVPFGPLLLCAPILGLGQGALSLAIAAAQEKPLAHTFFTHQSDSVGIQVQIAEAALKLQTARLHAYHVADIVDGDVVHGTKSGHDIRARAMAECGYAAQQALCAIDILVNVHGAGSFAKASPMQQIWRDANTAARHAGLNAYVGLEVLGKALLGVEERVSTML